MSSRIKTPFHGNGGKHEAKFGAQISQIWDNTTFSSVIRPSVTILDSSFANINNLVLNSQTQDFYIQPSLRQYRLWEQGYFAQDSYHATNRLTIDLGLRYELYNPFTEKNNLLSNAYLLDANNKPEACTPLPFDSGLSNAAVINPAKYGIGNYCTTHNYLSPPRRIRLRRLWHRQDRRPRRLWMVLRSRLRQCLR